MSSRALEHLALLRVADPRSVDFGFAALRYSLWPSISPFISKLQ
jgi:hypothetical protein